MGDRFWDVISMTIAWITEFFGEMFRASQTLLLVKELAAADELTRPGLIRALNLLSE